MRYGKKIPIVVAFVVFLLVGALVPLYGKASGDANFPSKQEIIMKTGSSNSLQMNILNFPSNGQIKNLKSSNKKILTVKTATGIGNVKSAIIVTAKKAGTARVSFDVVNKRTKKKLDHYVCKVTVRRFTSPFTKVTLNGKNMTSKFKGTPYISFVSDAKKMKLSIKMKKGYQLERIEYNNGVQYTEAKNGKTFRRTKKNNYAGEILINYSDGKGGYHSAIISLRTRSRK